MRGYSLFEILIVLSLICVTAFYAFPSLRQMVSNTTDTLAQHQLLQSIQQAQQIAMVNTHSVVMCLSTNEKTCNNIGDNLLAFSDRYHDGIMHESSQLLMITKIKAQGMLHLRVFPYYRHYVLFSNDLESGSDNGTFWFCSKQKKPLWAVAFSRLGEPHIIKNIINLNFKC